MMPITVAIVEDNKEIRKGYPYWFNGSEGFTCAATYPTAEAAIEGVKEDKPDVILMDIQLPGMSGLNV